LKITFNDFTLIKGAVSKLYFDLEFDRTANPDANGNELVDLFIKVSM